MNQHHLDSDSQRSLAATDRNLRLSQALQAKGLTEHEADALVGAHNQREANGETAGIHLQILNQHRELLQQVFYELGWSSK